MIRTALVILEKIETHLTLTARKSNVSSTTRDLDPNYRGEKAGAPSSCWD